MDMDTSLWILLGLAALYLLHSNAAATAGTNTVGTGNMTVAPTSVPIGVYPLVNGYFQGPAYVDVHVGLQVTPFYFPSGQIAFLMDGAGVQYDPFTGTALTSSYQPLTS